jgi:methionyl-tRNA synthetase
MKYYLTTPIYYVNAAPHIGHAYTTIVADLIKRFKRMQGFDPVVLTTGSDEHGVNVERAAERTGKSPKAFCDVIAAEFQNQWQRMALDVDHFQRTTDPKHAKVVQDLFDRCRKNGYIYKGSYTGQYCIFDNLYVNDAKRPSPKRISSSSFRPSPISCWSSTTSIPTSCSPRRAATRSSPSCARA